MQNDGFATARPYLMVGDIVKWKKWGYSLIASVSSMLASKVDAAMGPNTYVAESCWREVVFASTLVNPKLVMADVHLACGQITMESHRAFVPGDGWTNPHYLRKTLIDFLKRGRPSCILQMTDPRIDVSSAAEFGD
jgi:hypothetical protein